MHRFIKTLGPGILFASTAIGVSHLVQSTRAGAEYGFALLWAVLLANLLKYPFFEYGSRYASTTRTSLIDGYAKMGRWMLYAYALITVATMFFVTAAVCAVAAGFMDNLLGISAWSNWSLLPTVLVFLICGGILLLGRYALLDYTIKGVALLLLVSTLAAFFIALINGPNLDYAQAQSPEIWTTASLPFLIALMGWMPTAVDLSSWNSLWTLERIQQTAYRPSLRETLFEFRLGYGISAGLSVCFLTLGAFLLYGRTEAMPGGSAAFAHTVVGLYTETMGAWSYWIIALAGCSIMFGTAIGVLDGYARALERTAELVLHKNDAHVTEDRNRYTFSLLLTAVGGFAIIALFHNNSGGFKVLVDVATILSFLVAPLIAWANYRLVTAADFPVQARPGSFLRLLSVCGLVFLAAFALVFMLYLIGVEM